MATTTNTRDKVLVVDDERNILSSLKRLLITEDYDVLLADSGEKALQILKDNPDIALIISDQRMPGMSGAEFLELARKLSPDTIRMVLTGYADVGAAIAAINRGGAYRYLTKPWNDNELLYAVREGVRQYRLIRENRQLQEVIKQKNQELKQWNSQLEYYVQQQTIEIQNKNKELENLNKRLRNNFKNTIFSFSTLLEMREKGSKSHSRNVADLSVKIAKTLGLNSKDTEDIMVAALLHDIGKIAMPDLLIEKRPEEMSPDEFEIYRQHSVRGQSAIDMIEDLRNAGLIIRHHHENYDGTGFPDGLKREQIPLGARIIGIVDFLDREISKYNADNALELALSEVKKRLGRDFDPSLFRYITTPAEQLYAGRLPRSDYVELELSPMKLTQGMIVSRDFHSGTGLLLLKKGTVLKTTHIEAIKRYCRIDPSRSGVFVWMKRR